MREIRKGGKMNDYQLLGKLAKFVSELDYNHDFGKIDKTFVVSTGRTATKALAYFFANMTRRLVMHEPPPNYFKENIEKYQKGNKIIEKFKKDRAYYMHLAKMQNGKYIELNNGLWNMVEEVVKEPNTRVLVMVRDPRTWIVSMMNRGAYQKHDNWPRIVKQIEELKKEKPLRKLMMEWNLRNKKMMDHMNTNYLLVKYEEMYEKAKEIFDFMNFEDNIKEILLKEFPKLKKHRINKSVANIYPEFNNWNSKDKKMLYKICGTTMERLGYERIHTWEKSI